MSNGSGIHIVKRDGKRLPLDINKIHKVVQFACEGLSGVSISQVEMNSNLQFYDGMSTREIQDILIRSANDLISLEAPNYQYVAARLLLYGVYKDVFGEYKHKSFYDMIKLNIERGVYDPQILDIYHQILIHPHLNQNLCESLQISFLFKFIPNYPQLFQCYHQYPFKFYIP